MKKILFTFALSLGLSSAGATDYIAVSKDGNVYDQANTKYITENQQGDQIGVIPGMVFSTSEHVPGWYKVEYSPGLHAYIPEQIISGNFSVPMPGKYTVKNNPMQTITTSLDNGQWTASVNGKTYKGNEKDSIVVFTDDNNQLIFSLVDFGLGGIVISYDNSVTKFF